MNDAEGRRLFRDFVMETVRKSDDVRRSQFSQALWELGLRNPLDCGKWADEISAFAEEQQAMLVHATCSEAVAIVVERWEDFVRQRNFVVGDRCHRPLLILMALRVAIGVEQAVAVESHRSIQAEYVFTFALALVVIVVVAALGCWAAWAR